MDFLEELVKLQHLDTLNKLSDKLLTTKQDKQNFVNKFNKPNYQLIRITNTKMTVRKRVNINNMINKL
jgi:hypothetical protein